MWIINQPCIETSNVAITIHPKSLNWYLRYPCFKLITKPKKPITISIKHMKPWCARRVPIIGYHFPMIGVLFATKLPNE